MAIWNEALTKRVTEQRVPLACNSSDRSQALFLLPVNRRQGKPALHAHAATTGPSANLFSRRRPSRIWKECCFPHQ
jgi:hypothetical protein